LIDQVLRFFVFSNLHIALGAFFYLAGAFTLFQVRADLSLLFFTFFATMSTYAIHRHIGLQKISPEDHAERFRYFTKHGRMMRTLTLISAAGTLVSLAFVEWTVIMILFPCILVTGLYVLPILGSGKRLRDLSLIKIFLIAFVWAYIFMLPKLGYSSGDLQLADIAVFLEKLVFFVVLTLPFDMRDHDIDQRLGLRTLATSMSIRRQHQALLGGTVVCMVLSLVSFTFGTYSKEVLAGMIVFYGLLLPGITNSNHRSEMYFLGFLDGYILLHGFILIIMDGLSF
jgi:4-hydroxybenzoate polyprenyltransferase